MSKLSNNNGSQIPYIFANVYSAMSHLPVVLHAEAACKNSSFETQESKYKGVQTFVRNFKFICLSMNINLRIFHCFRVVEEKHVSLHDLKLCDVTHCGKCLFYVITVLSHPK